MKALFGGAIELKVPTGFIDASDLRQIPDNQEILLSTDNNNSIIIEILEINNESIEYYFNDLSETNESIESKILEKGTLQLNLSPTNQIQTIHGIQHVSKFNTKNLETLHIFICLYRIPDKNTDILVSINNPEDINAINQISKEDIDLLFSSLKIVDWNLFH